MNKERISRLADTIEVSALPVGFDMSDVCSSGIGVGDVIPCGTVCCIAGWACLLFGEDGDNISMHTARLLLDLQYFQGASLFADPKFFGATVLEEVTKETAVRVLRDLALRGEAAFESPLLWFVKL